MRHSEESLPPPRFGVVDRCVCVGMSFSRWLHIKETTGHTLKEMASLTRCGVECSGCAPYLAAVCATRKTEFKPMTFAELAKLGEGAV